MKKVIHFEDLNLSEFKFDFSSSSICVSLLNMTDGAEHFYLEAKKVIEIKYWNDSDFIENDCLYLGSFTIDLIPAEIYLEQNSYFKMPMLNTESEVYRLNFEGAEIYCEVFFGEISQLRCRQ